MDPKILTFSEDMDYCDTTRLEPIVKIRKKTVTSVSARSKPGIEEAEIGEEIDWISESRLAEELELEEEEGKWREDMLFKSMRLRPPPKEEEIDEEFTIDLWSEKESSGIRTVDSWDLPSGPIAWDDNDKPIKKLLNYADLVLTPEEENGLLTDRIVAACSSYLTESPGNKCHVVAKVTLSSKNLCDIRILGYHRFLQYVDLSWNNLTDLTPLGCIPYLMYLDVSHNLVREVLRFKSPMNLTYVNYSYNEVWQIDDLTDFWALCYLDLSHNKISKIQGLENLRYLRYLDLSHNQIERFENLSHLRISDLNLECNLISKFEIEEDYGIHTMKQLTNLYLGNNLIQNLNFLKRVFWLKKLELHNNNVSDLLELSNMKSLKKLRQLDMSGNPICKERPYRATVISHLMELKFLDGSIIDVSERVSSSKNARFEVQLEAARNNARLILLEQLNNTTLKLDPLSVDQPPHPFIILVGPSASSKRKIVAALGEKYPEKIYVGKLETTRQVLDSEKNVLMQTTREKFSENIKCGKFLCVTENLGHFYGFNRDELKEAIEENKLCLTAMDIVGALTIHSYGIQPFLVLTIPDSREEHIERLKMTYGPIMLGLGAAYITQRQLIETKETNVKRVASIINEIINTVLQTVGDSKIMSVSETNIVSADTKEKNTEVSENCKSYFEGEPDNLSDTIIFHAKENCFNCSPSRCGFQTSRLVESNVISSAKTTESKRLSASDIATVSESCTTSYSANDSPSPKFEIFSLGDSAFGENDPFINWSMPFVDWSEVNVNATQMEEAGEILCQKFIENVMATRDVYESLHLENPGLFSLSISTNDFNEACREVAKFLKAVWRSTPSRKPTYDAKDDRIYQAYIPKKLKKMKEILRNDFYSADGDGLSKCFSFATQLSSPVVICDEMRRKGYGDHVENV